MPALPEQIVGGALGLIRPRTSCLANIPFAFTRPKNLHRTISLKQTIGN